MKLLAAILAALWQALKPYLPEIKGGATGWLVKDLVDKTGELQRVDRASKVGNDVDSLSRDELRDRLRKRGLYRVPRE